MNCRYLAQCVSVISLAFFPQIILAQPHIAIHPYGADFDELTGQVKVYGQMIVQQAFDVQLQDMIKHVPIFSIQYAGLHHVAKSKDSEDHVEARAKCVGERLAAAWALLDQGGQLEVLVDDWNVSRLNGRDYPPKYPAIYVRSSSTDRAPLRIMTIYPEDVAAYPFVSGERKLAEYIVGLIQAHYSLFWKKESDISKYEALAIDRTREGKILKEVAVRAIEMARLKGLKKFNDEILKDALARIALQQRERLYRMALTAPIDWESSLR
jgi:hypothetical protein